MNRTFDVETESLMNAARDISNHYMEAGYNVEVTVELTAKDLVRLYKAAHAEVA